MSIVTDEAAWFPKRTVLRGSLRDDWAITAPGDLPSSDSYVYAVATPDGISIPRANGKTSRLLYVGKGYANRPELLRQGLHSASHALDQLRRAMGQLQMEVELWVCPASNSSLHEVKVLNRCAQVYGELPPANRKWEGYLSGAVVREMVAWAFAGASRAARRGIYEWPEEEPVAVWEDVYGGPGGGTWMFSLGWIHSPGLLAGRVHDVPVALQGKLVLVKHRVSERNVLADVPSLASWGPGELTMVDAPELDGLGELTALDAWLDTVTSTGWSEGSTPYETLRRTLEKHLSATKANRIVELLNVTDE